MAIQLEVQTKLALAAYVNVVPRCEHAAFSHHDAGGPLSEDVRLSGGSKCSSYSDLAEVNEDNVP